MAKKILLNGGSTLVKKEVIIDLPHVIILFHQILQFLCLFETNIKRLKDSTRTKCNSLQHYLRYHTVSSSKSSSSSSGISGGLKKLKKLSHFSIFVMGLAFFDPFRGFFFSSFSVKHFPGCHSISVLRVAPQGMSYGNQSCLNKIYK